MIYGHEPYAAVILEIVPLLRAHYQEIALNKDKIPLDPDYARYQELEDLGALDIFTARTDAGALVGYCITITGPHLHYKSTIASTVDILYLAPEYRGKLAGLRLIKHTEMALQARGVHIVTHHVKKAHDFGPILGRLGYEPVETMHAKYIGK